MRHAIYTETQLNHASMEMPGYRLGISRNI